MVHAYTVALKEIIARDDFQERAAAAPGDYPQLTGKGAQSGVRHGTQADPEARDFPLASGDQARLPA